MSTPPSNPLCGINVLVTRPVHQAAGLVERILALGASAIEFPTIEIEPIPISDHERELIGQATHCVFVSANAVRHGLEQVGLSDLLSKKIHAVGSSTKARLIHAGLQDILAPRGQSSETLLANWPREGCSEQRVVVFRGQGGRERLRQGLMQLGAHVQYVEVYRRRLPERTSVEPLYQALDHLHSPLFVTTTSVEGLENLLTLAGSRRAELTGCPLVVIGERQLRCAREMGWTGEIAHAEADDHSIADALVGLKLA